MTIDPLPVTPGELRARLHALGTSLPAHRQRAIGVKNGEPYLRRYVLAEEGTGSAAEHLYLHHFLRSDPDRELHSHPWHARSLILVGGYREERRFPWRTRPERWATCAARKLGWYWDDTAPAAEASARATGGIVFCRDYRPGSINLIAPTTFHRIDLVGEDCWTLCWTGPVEASWGFWDRHVGLFTPWRAFLDQRDRGAPGSTGGTP
jgi:hypothetical protein